MKPTVLLAAAGFAVTAVAFGPARVGFGLFLPVFREEFDLSTSTAGLIASGGFLAFLLALPASVWLGWRHGQRLPAIAGALAATAGFVAVAVAGAPGLLALGVALAGASAGLCWTPFNDAAERVVPHDERAGALSVVATGTTFGVVAAAGLALAVTEWALDWRQAWTGFALGGLAVAGIALAGLPRGRGPMAAQDAGAPAPKLAQRAALPLYAAALCFGMVNAVFLSFAADRVVAAGGLSGLPDEAASAVIFLAYGICGVLGLVTARSASRRRC